MRSSRSLQIGSRWTPAKLGPSLWIEPRRGGLYQSNAGTTSAGANSDVVGYCPDLSGNGFHLTSAADDTTRPTLQGVGSFPYLSFDGSNDLLRRTAAIGMHLACTVAVAFRGGGANLTARVVAEGSSATINTIISPLFSDGTTASSSNLMYRDDAGTNAIDPSIPQLTNVFNGSDHVYLSSDDGSNIALYKDGAAGTVASCNRSGLTYSPDRFALGGLLRTSAGSWWDGRIYGCVIVKRVLTEAERRKLTRYMGALAGLSL